MAENEMPYKQDESATDALQLYAPIKRSETCVRNASLSFTLTPSPSLTPLQPCTGLDPMAHGVPDAVVLIS